MSAVQGPFFPPLFDSNKEYVIASGVAEGKVMGISTQPENYGQSGIVMVLMDAKTRDFILFNTTTATKYNHASIKNY